MTSMNCLLYKYRDLTDKLLYPSLHVLSSCLMGCEAMSFFMGLHISQQPATCYSILEV
jgi:hypothetical protein